MITLEVNPDDVSRLGQLARDFQYQDAAAIPRGPGALDDDWPVHAPSSAAEDPALGEFRSIITDLEPDQQMQVVALLWLGRGDYSPEEWSDALRDARDAWNLRTADYLIAHPLLPEHLDEGLRLLGYDLD